jgi:neuroligin
VLENNFTFPGDEWYEGWRERDWRFLNVMPEQLVKGRHFNPALQYMTGVTTQEAAYFICKFIIREGPTMTLAEV